MNKTLRRRIAAIELQLPPMVPSAMDRLISIYDILIACAKGGIERRSTSRACCRVSGPAKELEKRTPD